MKKGDKQFDVGYGQGGGGGVAGAYKGPGGGSGIGGGGGRGPLPPLLPRTLPRKVVNIRSVNYDGNPFLRQPGESRAQPVLRAGVMAGASAAAAGAVGKSRKDRKDTERSIEYRKKPKMADAPPKINLRKAYED